ncbi:MAG: glycine cleavage T C-terminal barrel domain-containing protein [Actinomycetota bacterium]
MSSLGTITFDGVAVPFFDGDDVLTALVRAGLHPSGGGVLCTEGVSPHSLAEIDGVAYRHTGFTRPRDGMAVRSHRVDTPPVLPAASPTPVSTVVRNVHHPVVIVGGGDSGRKAAAEHDRAVIYDAHAGEEVVGIFPGPLVVVRTDDGMIHAHADHVVVATGALPIMPVCPGTDLVGLYTPGAARRLENAGIDLGRVLRVTVPPERFDGDGVVSSVVIDGERHECDSAVIELGTTPNDLLARMGGADVTVVGTAAISTEPPPMPTEGVVCYSNGVSVADLHDAWDRGFTDIELLKRATLAGTGATQGADSVPYLRRLILDRGGRLEDAFTARPVARQATLGELAAGRHHAAVPRTALHGTHLAAGATMDRLGGWWRPWTYGDVDAEYLAVREAVSLGDVGTLGKFIVSGPDAEAALQRLFPTDVATIRAGRSRYVLMLDERGYVVDDGMILREADGDRFYVTVTSGGASFTEMWVRDWTAHLDVRWMNVTMSLGAINVTGPRATHLMERAGLAEPLPMLHHRQLDIAGVPCRVVRLSFTGEISYELHHPFGRADELWQALLELGADLGVAPHGLDALTRLRLEKGHIIVGQDSDYDSTPRRLHHDWMVNLDAGGDFVGRHAVERTNPIPLDKMLVGLVSDGSAPFEGAVAWRADGEYAGYVTSSAWSPTLDHAVMLAWIRTVDGELPDSVVIDGQVARRVDLPFYDPDGGRARG